MAIADVMNPRRRLHRPLLPATSAAAVIIFLTRF
jgi:hypothetical protein